MPSNIVKSRLADINLSRMRGVKKRCRALTWVLNMVS